MHTRITKLGYVQESFLGISRTSAAFLKPQAFLFFPYEGELELFIISAASTTPIKINPFLLPIGIVLVPLNG